MFVTVSRRSTTKPALWKMTFIPFPLTSLLKLTRGMSKKEEFYHHNRRKFIIKNKYELAS